MQMAIDHRANTVKIFETFLFWKRNTSKREVPLEAEEYEDKSELRPRLFRMPRDIEIFNQLHDGISIVSIGKVTIMKWTRGVGIAKRLDIIFIFEKYIVGMSFCMPNID